MVVAVDEEGRHNAPDSPEEPHLPVGDGYVEDHSALEIHLGRPIALVVVGELKGRVPTEEM
jgi:hypothetical protein